MLTMFKNGIVSFFLMLLIAFQTSAFAPRTAFSSRSRTQLYAEKPFAVIVRAEIEIDRMGEFMEMIETNAVESRKEPGCIRFDVVRSQDHLAEFFFYEVYVNTAAVEHHKNQSHYKSWADFKESGGTVSSVSYKAEGEFLS